MPSEMERRKKIRNRIIELCIWEIIWGAIGFFIVGGFFQIIIPALGLILGLIGGIITYFISYLFTNRCPYCDMILPRKIEVCPDCKRSDIRNKVRKN